jgi:FhuF 2Fe-2S C-terminal domain
VSGGSSLPAPQTGPRDVPGGADLAARHAAELAQLGPYFAVSVHLPGQPLPAPWRPLSTLLDSPEDLQQRIAEVRAALAAGRPPDAVEFRVAASVTHLGVAARLISPALGTAVLLGRRLRMDPAEVAWQPVLGGPLPLSLPASALTGPGDQLGAGQLASELRQGLLNGPVRALTGLTATMSVSPIVLQGNIASAVNAAAAMIATARPGLASRAGTIRSAVLSAPELAGTWTSSAAGFRRRSCCLIYRAAPAATSAVCGDCILNATSPPPRMGTTRPLH